MDLPRENCAQLNLPSYYGEMIPSEVVERAVCIFYYDFSKVLNKLSHGILVVRPGRYRLNGWTTAWLEKLSRPSG